ncbi:alpha/beta fold hydrolase [Cyanobium sp. LEGE 06143]|uniref:alpha/beta fold hydrolase n=1 Tax=Cyanobium sp. LEGE 06143 TaxID=945727 RepID=UPI0018800EE9|nr:alpha/beta fold hydrolase [Cyanobium sp. LEGE 06143]MBE9172414.1 alpha/beta fold hydrolase [Cyanobium sp. LEGE 06143]
MLRRFLPALASLPLLLGAAPARAIDEVVLQLPLIDFGFTVRLSEFENPERFWAGTSDLAELNRATNGAVDRQMRAIFDTPLPVQTRDVVSQAAGSPLLQQVLLAASALGQVDGLPLDASGEELTEVLNRASTDGQITLYTLLRAIPGESVTVDLPGAVASLQRLTRQQSQARALVESVPPASVAPARSAPGSRPVRRSVRTMAAPHRDTPLEVVLVEPSSGANGRVVVISHGLWDSPEAFEGWAFHLASHGYSVALPNHPGSDATQQKAMLSGQTPPPGPEELRLRPLDVSAVIDGMEASRVVVLGHSWGATTALQLAGTQPSSRLLLERCDDLGDPDRNISWVLQCSFLSSADQASLADPRVIAVMAVSAPASLLFDYGAGAGMQARALVVTGSRDWVVPPDPEALDLVPPVLRFGHQLVAADGGDHFNLRAEAGGNGGPLRGLVLAWSDAAFAAGAAAKPEVQAPPLLGPGGWGNTDIPLILMPTPTP